MSPVFQVPLSLETDMHGRGWQMHQKSVSTSMNPNVTIQRFDAAAWYGCMEFS